MIKVNFIEEEKVLCLTLTGHAGYAEPGKDIVCSAASILVYTLAQSVATIADQGGLDGNPVIKLGPGDVCIRAIPVSGMYETVQSAFIFAVIGYRLLEKQYPTNVRIKMYGDE